jgi:hypothetical protein
MLTDDALGIAVKGVRKTGTGLHFGNTAEIFWVFTKHPLNSLLLFGTNQITI